MTAPAPQVFDLAALALEGAGAGRTGAVWSLISGDLNLNLVRFAAGEGVTEHVNAEVDVVGLVVSGAGTVEVEGHAAPVRTGQLFLIPKGARRAIRAVESEMSYLTCHPRRSGLMPERAHRRPRP